MCFVTLIVILMRARVVRVPGEADDESAVRAFERKIPVSGISDSCQNYRKTCRGRATVKSVVDWIQDNGAATEARIVSALRRDDRSPSAIKSELQRALRGGRIHVGGAVREGRGFITLYCTDDNQLLREKNPYLLRLKIDEEIRSKVEAAVEEAEKSGVYWSGSPEALTTEKIAAEVGSSVSRIEDAFYLVTKERKWKWDSVKGGFWRPKKPRPESKETTKEGT